MRVKKHTVDDHTGWLPGFELEATEVVVAIADADGGTAGDDVAMQDAFDRPVQVRFRIGDTAMLGGGGPLEMARRNLDAVRVLKAIEAQDRAATEAEKAALVQYAGWGGVAAIFEHWHASENWRAMQEELQALLSEDEWDAARSSVNNAHYTEPMVIRHIYGALAHLGFDGGKILEPAAGIGHFIGCMPDHLHAHSTVTAIEIDPLSGRIAKLLYGDADIRIDGFERVSLPNNYYDLAVSNVPFGNYSVTDPEYDRYKYLIHDYFFAKALDKVRPGGLLAFITSIGTLDKNGSGLRAQLSQRADLLGAMRLPACAFKRIANTEVVTDVVFLRKLLPGELPKDSFWKDLETLSVRNPHGTEHLSVNAYFVRHPSMILGNAHYRYNPRGHNLSVVLPKDGDLDQMLTQAITALPQDVYKPCDAVGEEMTESTPATLAPDFVKPNAFFIADDTLCVSENGLQKEVTWLPAATAARVRGMVQVRDAIRAVLASQVDGSDDESVSMRRLQLNSAYDTFVQQYGYLSEKRNRRAYSGDPDLPLLLSLENFNEETQTADKAEVFFMRTVQRPRPVESAATAPEALVHSLNERGRVDLAYMARLLGSSVLQVTDTLSAEGLIFRNPESRQWELADEYLSGNVRDKLLQATAAAELDRAYERNVAALRQVQPADIAASEIDGRLGSSWIPASDIEAFLVHLLHDHHAKVNFSPMIGTWTVESGGWGERFSNANTQTYGTAYYTAAKLIEDALNLRLPTVYYETKDKKRRIDIVETAAAREKQERIKEAFRSWLWEDDARRHRLVRTYNDQFNTIRVRQYDGSKLTLPGISSAVTLQQHQRDGIWRGIVGGNLLLAHAVGSGKTMILCSIAMELRRLGLAKKPLIAIPNHMLEQFSAEFLRLYPLANILIASRDDFVGDKRRVLVSRIATGDWDAVIITHATFEKIPMSAQAIEEQISHEIAELEAAILIEKAKDGSRRLVKQLEAAKKRLRTRLEKMVAATKKDCIATFEELGVDTLLVDEAHLFKNLFFATKMTRIAGLPQTNSQRAFDMYLKCQYVARLNRYKRGIVFATATPISNSMAEMFTMQRYLQSLMLEYRGVAHFDAWAANFGETVTALEIAPDGSGYRLNTRFARFCNLPELMQMFRSVADIRTEESLNLPVPELEGGKPQAVVAQPSERLTSYVEGLVARAEALKKHNIDPRLDNMLKITNDGRKAALDMRLIDPSLSDDSNSKLNLAVNNIVRIWEEYALQRATQIVFCDLSAPTYDGSFSVYTDMRAKLVARGIPAEEIAFIHDFDSDAQKAALFRQVRQGVVRVLFGSTPKLGIGTNVQTRLRAIHHLDSPWRPADIEQRDGRGRRQGNMFEMIAIYRYVTERSFDAFMWQCLESKLRFVRQVLNGDAALRTMEDTDGTALSYAEIKALASGNPLVIEKAGIDADVAKYSLLKSAHLACLYRLRDELASIPSRLKWLQNIVAKVEADISSAPEVPTSITVQGQRFNVVAAAEDDLRKAIKGVRNWAKLRGNPCHERIGQFGSFRLFVNASASARVKPEFVLEGNYSYTFLVGGRDESVSGAIVALVKGLQSKREDMLADISRLQRRISDLEHEAAKPYEYEERLQRLLARQAEINDLLDLNKNQAPIMEEEEEQTVEA